MPFIGPVPRRTHAFNRRIKPAALSLTIAAIVQASALLPVFSWHDQYHDSSSALADFIEHGAGVIAALIAIAFIYAWWRNCAKCLDRALSGSTILWLWVAAVGMLQFAPLGRVLLAVAWAVLAAGSAWLETGEEEQ